MHTRHALAILLLTSSLILGTTPVLADSGPQVQVVSGYHVALTLPAGPAQTQSTDLVITLRDPDGAPVANATVTAAVLGYRSESDPHAADSHAASETTEHATDSHAASETTEHTHDGATASEGHGAEMIPVLLEPGTEPGTYRGPLFFTEPGVATVTVAFTIDGQDRAALFSIPVAPARPRGLILGAFAAINMLAITGAAILKWRTPRKIRSTTATISTKRPTDRTTSAPTQEGDLA